MNEFFTQMNESCHTYEWVMPHIWMSHITHMNESCHTYEWVMSHIWMSPVTHMNESCHTPHTYDDITSRTWRSHATHTHTHTHTHTLDTDRHLSQTKHQEWKLQMRGSCGSWEVSDISMRHPPPQHYIHISMTYTYIWHTHIYDITMRHPPPKHYIHISMTYLRDTHCLHTTYTYVWLTHIYDIHISMTYTYLWHIYQTPTA